MKIIEFDDKGRRIESDANAPARSGNASSLAPRPNYSPARRTRRARGASLRDRIAYVPNRNAEDEDEIYQDEPGRGDFEIPVPWFLIKHPQGNVVIDGGNAVEAAIDKRGHWGAVVDAYDPVMPVSENCVDQLKMVGVSAQDVRYVVQSHLHLDHTGAIGRFPKAQHIVQRSEYEYAFKPHWFSAGAYIRADFDRPGLNWKFLGGEFTDNFDLFGDGTVRMIFTPGHSPGHQSFLITLPESGPILLTIDAAYTVDHWENRALPGLVTSSMQAADSVAKLRRIAKDTNAMVVTGHDPVTWPSFRKSPQDFYD